MFNEKLPYVLYILFLELNFQKVDICDLKTEGM